VNTTSSGYIAAQQPKSFATRLAQSRETGIIAALLIMVVGLSVFEPDFASSETYPSSELWFSAKHWS
jgi:fucose permease